MPGIPSKLLYHLAPPPPLPAYHCREESDTVSHFDHFHFFCNEDSIPMHCYRHFYLRSSSNQSSSLRSSERSCVTEFNSAVLAKVGFNKTHSNDNEYFHTVFLKVRPMFKISDSILKQAQQCLVNYVLNIPTNLKHEISGEELEPTLRLVQIYFNTATFELHLCEVLCIFV